MRNPCSLMTNRMRVIAQFACRNFACQANSFDGIYEVFHTNVSTWEMAYDSVSFVLITGLWAYHH